MNYFFVIEKGDSPNSFGAYVPDLPGCVATGSTRAQVRSRIVAAVEMHLEGMLEDGEQPPKPTAPEYMSVISLPSVAENAFRVKSLNATAKKLLEEAAVRAAHPPHQMHFKKSTAKKTTTGRRKKTTVQRTNTRRKS